MNLILFGSDGKMSRYDSDHSYLVVFSIIEDDALTCNGITQSIAVVVVFDHSFVS